MSSHNDVSLRGRVAHLQSRGQWGARDFDKVMFQLPIPQFDPLNPLHCELVAVAEMAEEVAAGVNVPSSLGFIRHRQIIRMALIADGVAGTIDGLVADLLNTNT